MTAHFTTYNQPDGFEALESETGGFTEIMLSRRAPSVTLGDKVVHLQHTAAASRRGCDRDG